MKQYFSLALLVLVAAFVTLLALPHLPARRSEPTVSVTVQVQPEDEQLRLITVAIETALSAEPPSGYARIPNGVRLLRVHRTATGSIILNFNKNLLTAGTGAALEDALHQLLTAASSVSRPGSEFNYQILIEGKPLEAYLR